MQLFWNGEYRLCDGALGSFKRSSTACRRSASSLGGSAVSGACEEERKKKKIIYGYGIRITVILRNIRVRQLGTTERTMFQIMNFPLNAVIKATVAVWATIA